MAKKIIKRTILGLLGAAYLVRGAFYVIEEVTDKTPSRKKRPVFTKARHAATAFVAGPVCDLVAAGGQGLLYVSDAANTAGEWLDTATEEALCWLTNDTPSTHR